MGDDANEYIGDLIETVVWRVLSGVHTCFPAVITKVSASKTNKMSTVVDVTAALGELNPISNSPDPIEILNIPLVYPGRTDKFIIRPPVDSDSLVGAFVKISVSDTFIADWKKTGGSNLVINDKRRFDRRDAIAEFGLYPDSKPWPTEAKDKTAQMKVGPGIFLEIGNSQADILRILSDIASLLSTASTSVDGAPVPLAWVPPLAIDPNGPLTGKPLAALVTDLATLANPNTDP